MTQPRAAALVALVGMAVTGDLAAISRVVVVEVAVVVTVGVGVVRCVRG